ncbi:MAG: dihydroxy-acid dehydratase, partial [Halanaeroarchaeum sp.]
MNQQSPDDAEGRMRHDKDPSLPSNDVTEGVERAPHRAMFRAMGYDDEDFGSPMIGIANPAADITPCNVHLDQVAESAYDGIDEADGMPIEFGTITISDAISMG